MSKIPKALPRLSGGQLPGRSKAEEGREGEEEEEEEEGQLMEHELMNAIQTKEPGEMDEAKGHVTWKSSTFSPERQGRKGSLR